MKTKKMKTKMSHIQKSLLISLFIELLIIFLLFKISFKEKPKEEVFAINFADEDFDELKNEEKIELPDISKYINNKQTTNIASNEWQKEKSFEEYKEQHDNAFEEFYKNRENKENVSLTSEKFQKKQKNKKEKRFTGNSNIKYFLKNRFDIIITNPLYTCPKYMNGLIVIDIEVDRNGNVVSAKYNKDKSTTSAICLIDEAISAAYNSSFNSDYSAPPIQKGYITYLY